VPKNIATPLLGTSSSLTLKLDSDVLIIVSVAVNHKHHTLKFLSEDCMFGDAQNWLRIRSVAGFCICSNEPWTSAIMVRSSHHIN